MEYLKDAPEIIEAILAMLGGLKIIMHYIDKENKWKWDDKVIAFCDSPLRKALSFFKKK